MLFVIIDHLFVSVSVCLSVCLSDLLSWSSDVDAVTHLKPYSELAQNESLESLDLSWNNLRQRGALAVAEGLQENIGLKFLILAWNGFGDAGAIALGTALQHNRFHHASHYLYKDP